MSRADDIAILAGLAEHTRLHLPGTGGMAISVSELEAVNRIVPEAVAALRFVEEHGETVRVALSATKEEAYYGGAYSHHVPLLDAAITALEALHQLTAERGEP